eukprot:8096515-Alexandrium_andersonii.AAC.1
MEVLGIQQPPTSEATMRKCPFPRQGLALPRRVASGIQRVALQAVDPCAIAASSSVVSPMGTVCQ